MKCQGKENLYKCNRKQMSGYLGLKVGAGIDYKWAGGNFEE